MTSEFEKSIMIQIFCLPERLVFDVKQKERKKDIEIFLPISSIQPPVPHPFSIEATCISPLRDTKEDPYTYKPLDFTLKVCSFDDIRKTTTLEVRREETKNGELCMFIISGHKTVILCLAVIEFARESGCSLVSIDRVSAVDINRFIVCR